MFVKICGLTNAEDALLAVALGADALGFMFAPSTRQISIERARDIARQIPPEIITLGVFRGELPDRMVRIVHEAGLRGAQLHGHETPDQTRFVKERVEVVFKVFGAGHPALDDVRPDGTLGGHTAQAFLVDHQSGGGTGKTFDWSTVEGLSDRVRLIVAGGLNPDNVAEAIARIRPFGVDVSTGVERSPGEKDPALLHHFLANAKGAVAAS